MTFPSSDSYKNPFKENPQIKFLANEVFIKIPAYRKFENVELFFNESSRSLTILFDQTLFIFAIILFQFYLSEPAESDLIIFNNHKFNPVEFLKIKSIEHLLKETNSAQIFFKDDSDFHYVKQLIVFKVLPNYDEEHFLREILDQIQ